MRPISSTSRFIASASGDIADQRELELEAGEHGAQVVRDAGQHGGALVDGALDARLHLDEGGGRAPHLARAARAEVRHVAALAEALDRLGEPQDRPDLVAQEQDRDGEQHQRGADHPQQEDFGVRRIGGVAAREHPHDRVVELDADLDQRRACPRCRSRTAGRSACGSLPTAPGRAARRTASGRSAASRSPAGNRPAGRAARPRCGGCCVLSASCG